MEKEWFATWFDSPYYHLLYQSRDEQEARDFIHRLNNILMLSTRAEVLDLACGKGRHAITLHDLGYQVIGADLSCASIREARIHQKEGLEFIVQDMRLPIAGRKFDAVFNLFTSFGYFDSMDDNLTVLRSIHSMLKPGGTFVLDFMNSAKVIRTLVEDEVKTIEGIRFHIERTYNGTHIRKNISFEDCGHAYHFTESVQALLPEDFRNILSECGFRILHEFGDFDLHSFDAASSDRFIIIAEKI